MIIRNKDLRNWKRTSCSNTTMMKTKMITIFIFAFLVGVVKSTHEDCPWYRRDEGLPDEIKSNCICATNPSSNNQLSVQCHDIHAETLVSILQEFQAGIKHPLELLYLNGSRVTNEAGMLLPNLFGDLKIVSLQLSGCKISSIHKDSFSGSEEHLKHLSLAQNDLSSVPTPALEGLSRLSLLDLSYNKIGKVAQKAFFKLNKLATLKLHDNNLELHPEAFTGLERSLRNLNLKGTRISHIPEAINNLSALAFLDLAQNRLREVEPYHFIGLHSLSALNLERNLLQSLPESVFEGINDTLSSLSLLNNLITNFPRSALKHLHELRVLDLGFNLLTEIPQDAFFGLKSLTLLALDGNPLATLAEPSFAPLNTTLRGISLGGRFLNCDCRLQWILEWVQLYDLQVTSRERNPQFCGTPNSLRALNFYQIQPEDLACPTNETVKKTEYDVNLSPEDIALLGMGSSAVYISQKDKGGGSSSSTSVEESNEQETEENRTTFTLESPAPVIPKRNVTNNKVPPRFKPRRPRPTNKFTTKAQPPTSSSSTSTTPISTSSSSTTTTTITIEEVSKNKKLPPHPHSVDSDSQEENSGKEVSSIETLDSNSNNHNNGGFLANPITRKPIKSYSERLGIQIQPGENSEPRPTIPPTPQTSSTTTRNPVKNPPIRPNTSVRHRITSKVIPTTSNPAPKITTSTTSNPLPIPQSEHEIEEGDESSKKVPNKFQTQSPVQSQTAITSSSVPRPTITSIKTNVNPNVASPPQQQRIIPTSKTIDAIDIDDSKIPIISGIGSAVSSPNLHTGSIMSVKQPLPVQTQNQQQQQNVLSKSLDTLLRHIPTQSSPQHPHNLLIFADKSEILVHEIVRNGDSIMLHWESSKQVSGFRIIYRLFGEDTFRHGPPLAPTETEYRIKNVPNNECVVICVVPYEEILYNEISPSAASVPPGSQCREVKPISPSALMNHMDKITIGASVAICVTVLLAVLIFIGITKRAKSKRPSSTSTLMAKVSPSSFMTPIPGPRHDHVTITSGGGGGGYGMGGMTKDWDQISVVSTKSIPRARVYHGSMDGLANPPPPTKTSTLNPHFHRSAAGVGPDGLLSTHRSFSTPHHHHHHNPNHNNGTITNNNNNNGSYQQHHHQHQNHGNVHITHGNAASAVNNYLNNQNRLLRTSLGSRASYDALNKLATVRHSHHQFEHFRRKRSTTTTRLNQSESLNTLNGYETPDNWTDHDMDFYVARNHTRNHNLVQL